MISRTFALVLLALSLMLTGCAAGLRAGGSRHGAGAGVAIVPPPPAPAP